MTTFPAATTRWAVRFEHVPDGTYYGGKNARRDNPVEASRVADLVIAQARHAPELSLGVITFSEAQQQAVAREIADRVRAAPDLEALLDEEGSEGFFIKNIENVQGDERDVIFLSVGYGPGPNGVVFQRFGPLSQAGGERRLNVAITRARLECVVVASLLPADITSERTGPRLLRGYLEYARGGTGGAQRSLEAAPPRQSDFEQIVERALVRRGHAVRRQVGLSDSRVDLAIVNPSDPSRYLLGIECDGPTYRNVPTASARDRLRPAVLRGFGWCLHRVWSEDWVRDSESEIAKIEAALVRLTDDETVAPQLPFLDSPPSAASELSPPAPLPSLPPGVTRYEQASVPLPGGASALFGGGDGPREEFVCQLVGLEGPLSIDVAAQRLAVAAGLTRAGRRVRAILEETVDTLLDKGILEQRDEFLWTRGNARPPARAPKDGEAPRPIDQISLEEIGEISVALLRVAFGMRREELVLETARLLGYRSAGAAVRERVNAALSLLELDNRLHVQGGQVRSLEV